MADEIERLVNLQKARSKKVKDKASRVAISETKESKPSYLTFYTTHLPRFQRESLPN